MNRVITNTTRLNSIDYIWGRFEPCGYNGCECDRYIIDAYQQHLEYPAQPFIEMLDSHLNKMSESDYKEIVNLQSETHLDSIYLQWVLDNIKLKSTSEVFKTPYKDDDVMYDLWIQTSQDTIRKVVQEQLDKNNICITITPDEAYYLRLLLGFCCSYKDGVPIMQNEYVINATRMHDRLVTENAEFFKSKYKCDIKTLKIGKPTV